MISFKWDYDKPNSVAFDATDWAALGAVPNTDENTMLTHLGGEFNAAEVEALKRASAGRNNTAWFWQAHPSNPSAIILCLACYEAGRAAVLIQKPERGKYVPRNSFYWKIRQGDGR